MLQGISFQMKLFCFNEIVKRFRDTIKLLVTEVDESKTLIITIFNDVQKKKSLL